MPVKALVTGVCAFFLKTVVGGKSGDTYLFPGISVHPILLFPLLRDSDRKQAARFNAETAEHAEKGADWGKANDKQQ